jgi:hypothetical protein
MDRTSAQPQENLSLLRSNTLNFQPLLEALKYYTKKATDDPENTIKKPSLLLIFHHAVRVEHRKKSAKDRSVIFSCVLGKDIQNK